MQHLKGKELHRDKIKQGEKLFKDGTNAVVNNEPSRKTGAYHLRIYIKG